MNSGNINRRPPPIGKRANTQKQPQTTANQALNAGYICLAIAVGAVLIGGPFGWLLAGPLTTACVVLSIITMTKGRTSGGVILLVTSLTLPAFFTLIWYLFIAALFIGVSATA